MPRRRPTPNWKTAPALAELKAQVDTLYEDALAGRDVPGQEIDELIIRTRAAFLALRIEPERLYSVLDQYLTASVQ